MPTRPFLSANVPSTHELEAAPCDSGAITARRECRVVAAAIPAGKADAPHARCGKTG
jgi:hypothetical protein